MSGRRVTLVLTIMLLLLAATAVLAVALTVTSKRIAGSEQVDVGCPARGSCSATVKWSLDSDYMVDKCIVSWTADFDGTATITCQVYDNGGNLIRSGSLTRQSVSSGSSYNHEITFSPSIDPKDIYKVRVVIMEE